MSKLEIATYVCLITGCVVSTGLQLERRFGPIVIRKVYIAKLGPAQEVEFLGILASGAI